MVHGSPALRASGAALSFERRDLEGRVLADVLVVRGRGGLGRERLEVGEQRLHARQLDAAEERLGRLSVLALLLVEADQALERLAAAARGDLGRDAREVRLAVG